MKHKNPLETLLWCHTWTGGRGLTTTKMRLENYQGPLFQGVEGQMIGLGLHPKNPGGLTKDLYLASTYPGCALGVIRAGLDLCGGCRAG